MVLLLDLLLSLNQKVIIFVSEIGNCPTYGGVLLSEKDKVGKTILFPPDNKIEEIIETVRSDREE